MKYVISPANAFISKIFGDNFSFGCSLYSSTKKVSYDPDWEPPLLDGSELNGLIIFPTYCEVMISFYPPLEGWRFVCSLFFNKPQGSVPKESWLIKSIDKYRLGGCWIPEKFIHEKN